ncbi:diguanylate cyclase domain-containing protein [Azonexus sp.]|uniref:diguanylate cyclase domain-containing protein n=1 Tax=Azonexus sp. TaxID=1872668 RepID=UPI0039E51E44
MKILLVDDSRAIAMITTARLESFGHEVRHAINGPTAIDLFQKEDFDLILMDIEMPGMNGFETTTRIRSLEGHEQWAWTPIIFVTATDSDDNLVTAIEAGGDDFISKGVAESVLQAKMKAMSRIATLRARLAQANNRLQDQANHDGLTGLYNRRAMDLRVDLLWESAVQNGYAFGLLMIDVDNFKKYNDHYGHLAGDDCLCRVAACLEETAERINAEAWASGVFAARYGGEEFCVILPEAGPEVHERAGKLMVEAVAALKLPHEQNAGGYVTISAGAIRVMPAEGWVKEAFRLADELLYQAKSGGRNRCVAN